LQEYSDEQLFDFIEIDNWLDLGHFDTYFESKKEVETRYFNTIEIDKDIIPPVIFNAINRRRTAEALKKMPVPTGCRIDLSFGMQCLYLQPCDFQTSIDLIDNVHDNLSLLSG
jgi:hypothetical protein